MKPITDGLRRAKLIKVRILDLTKDIATPWLLLSVLWVTTLSTFGSDLSFVGSGSYDIVGNSVVLRSDRIENNDFWGRSGTIRLELWAFSSPYPGTTVGYKLASHTVGQLDAGYYYYNITSGYIPFVTPPPGIWYLSLQVREYTGYGSDGFTTRDWINFSSKRVAGGAMSGDNVIGGLTSWEVSGSSVNIRVAKVSNICNLGVSGSLRLDLWATAGPYYGGTITGYRCGSVSLPALVSGYSHLDINQTVPLLVRPPDGTYNAVLTLSEFANGAYVITDYLNYDGRWTVGTPPTPPLAKAATMITSSGFVANWSSVSTATAYYVDVSTSSAFTSFVSQNMAVGNTVSVNVNGLNPATAYYYRVRAYNGAGVSGNSGTIAVTTLVKAPPPPAVNPASSVTSGSFTAGWNAANGATGYRLDVSSSSSFSNVLPGYQDLDVGSALTRTVSGLSAGTAYYYRLRAYNAGGTSGYSEVGSLVTLVNPPVAPVANAGISVSSTSFMANWGSVSTATGYRLDVSRSSTFTTYLPGHQDLDVGKALNFTVSGLSPSTVHYYRVRAYNAGGTSSNSVRVAVTTLVNPPLAPIAKVAASVTASGFIASWNSAATATAYRLDVATDIEFGNFVAGYQDLALGNVLSRSVTGLSAGKPYYYRVRASNAGGTSDNSGTINVTTSVTIPPAPVATPASDLSTTGFTANWVAANMGAGYRLDVSTSASFSSYVSGYQNVDVGNSVSRAVGGLTSGRTYYYRVRAYNAAGTSASSATVSAVTETFVPMLSGFRQGNNLVLSWPTNATGFTLQKLGDIGTWSNATPAPVVVNGKYTVTNGMSGNMMLYRLRK